MARLPVREILMGLAARVPLVFLWNQGTVRLRADRSPERVIERLAVDPGALDAAVA